MAGGGYGELWIKIPRPKDIKNDKDLVEYFQKVFKIREELEENGSSWSYPGSDRAAECAVPQPGLVPKQKTPFVFCYASVWNK